MVFLCDALYASVRDHKTHTVPDSVHVLADLIGSNSRDSLAVFPAWIFLVPLHFWQRPEKPEVSVAETLSRWQPAVFPWHEKGLLRQS